MRTKNKVLTNVQVMQRLMENSSFGALAQVFIIDAVKKQAQAVVDSKPEDYPEGCFVSPSAWIGTAKEILAQLEERGY